MAHRVMERSPHSLLMGEGAVGFAREQGFPVEPNEAMLTPHSTQAYQVPQYNGFGSYRRNWLVLCLERPSVIWLLPL